MNTFHPSPLHVRTSSIRWLPLLPWLLVAGCCLGAAAPVPDEAALKVQLDAREKRADLLLDELRAMDNRIEATVDKILETLRMIGDSKDSRTKVARLKEQTIAGLQKNITFYQQRRAQLQEEMRRPALHLTTEEKQRAIAKFDARIEKRVRQIIEMTASLPTHKDYERYKTVDGGWYGPNYVVNEDYKQNKRLTAHTNAQREAILKGLKQSLDRIDRQIRSLQSQLATATTEAHRKVLTEEIARYEALLKTRRAQVVEVNTAYETPTKPLSGKEAQDLDMSLRKAVDSLRRDFATLFQRYSAYLVERSNVNASKAALAAVKK